MTARPAWTSRWPPWACASPSESVPDRMLRLALANPNTSATATARMLADGRSVLPAGVQLDGHTAAQGSSFIADAASLAQADRQMQALGSALLAGGCDALITAAFGDPGLAGLRASHGLRVTGLGEAGILEAAAGGRRYAIVTVTPALRDRLQAAALALAPAAQLAGIRFAAPGADAPLPVPEALVAALLQACRLAVDRDGAQAIVIGGGPLAHTVPALARQLPVPVVNPVQAAVRLACQRLGLAT